MNISKTGLTIETIQNAQIKERKTAQKNKEDQG